MKMIVCLLTLSVILRGQDPKVKAENKPVPVLSDKDKVDFLLVQRDWMAVQKQYEDAFKREPKVVEYEAKGQVLAKKCQEGGAQFNAQKVACELPPDKPASTK
jgi:hypothetical protein